MSINVDSLSLKSFDMIWYMQELKVISLKNIFRTQQVIYHSKEMDEHLEYSDYFFSHTGQSVKRSFSHLRDGNVAWNNNKTGTRRAVLYQQVQYSEFQNVDGSKPKSKQPKHFLLFLFRLLILILRSSLTYS